MEIKYRNDGAVFIYSGVSRSLFEALNRSPHPGEDWLKIRDSYSYGAASFHIKKFNDGSTVIESVEGVLNISERNLGAVMSELQTRNRFKNRKQDDVNPEAPSRVQKARKARDHGTVRNADGSLHSTPNPGHKPGRNSTDGGNQ